MGRFWLVCLLSIGSWSAANAGNEGHTPKESYFAFDSAFNSFVGQGKSNYYVSRSTGWYIGAGGNFDNGITVRIERSTGPDPQLLDYYWTLDFAAPFEQRIVPGLYSNAARFPIQDPNQPGLGMSGNHHGNNSLSGDFEVYQAIYGPHSILRFHATFTVYESELPSRWIRGEIFYNALPEPSSALFVATGVLSVSTCPVAFRRRRVPRMAYWVADRPTSVTPVTRG